MAGRRGEKEELRPIGDLSDPHGFAYLLEEHLDWLRERNFAESTTKHRHFRVAAFAAWCAERGVPRPSQVTKPIIERYQRHLFYTPGPSGKPRSFRLQGEEIRGVRGFFKWLARQNHILYNPAADLELPRQEHRLPKAVLTASEAEKVLNLPDISTALGLRDRAILETLYSTGMRRMELVHLKLPDLDYERGVVTIRLGKWRKDRMIPIGERAATWIEKYAADARPELASGADDGTLFLTHTGLPFVPEDLTHLARGYVDRAELGKQGACHLFRHTMATLMHENGADIRFVQQMLGHASIKTTEIYTRVAIRALKEVHTRTHPGATLERKRPEAV